MHSDEHDNPEAIKPKAVRELERLIGMPTVERTNKDTISVCERAILSIGMLNYENDRYRAALETIRNFMTDDNRPEDVLGEIETVLRESSGSNE